ncbi:hypothetical protein KIW84_034894 [Lathyrus oleraceus]|uniref:Uncharacterized protein n=1 Tax=Pisum sativum TaxID=3888 RepID=A0A9D4Y1I1_PEA|nr:hypothetical protein KIW84_034894 [Pisum sativum]
MSVAEAGYWYDPVWRWEVHFPVFVVDFVMIKEQEELDLLLHNSEPAAEVEDCFQWDSMIPVAFLCVFAGNVCKGIERWLGIELVLDSNSIDSYVDFGRSLRKEVDNKLGNVIWAASIWQIWASRNNLIFRGKAFSVEYIVLSSIAHGVGCV